MPRKHDPEKTEKIRSVLKDHPQGLWVREIARKTELDKSTVSIYLSTHMKDEIDHAYSVAGGLIKIVKLKTREAKV